MSEFDVQRAQRLSKIEALKGKGINPYPNNFRPSLRIPDFIEEYREYKEEVESQDRVSLAGRLIAKRGHGKTCFGHLLGDGTKAQIYARKDRLKEGAYEAFQELDMGDIIGVTGPIFRTRTGELTVIVEEFCLLTKALRPLPEKWHGLKDIEMRYRHRYLDLLTNQESREVFITRFKIIKIIRGFLDRLGFLEVETPMMQAIPGGATARPFKTYHNALDRDLYLRIAPELYLKRLVVGGMERVYELNRNFRNEGLSTEHNPEFTMLEFYRAYADYRDLMELTEKLFWELGDTIKGSPTIEYQGHTIDFTPPWKRVTLKEAILLYTDLQENDLTNTALLGKKLTAEGVPLIGNEACGKLLMKIFETFVESQLIQPTLVTDFPKEVSPLARSKDSEPDIVERFELYVAGRELANAFSELNDPLDQKERFLSQAEGLESQEEEIRSEAIFKRVDEEYIQALEHGLPPAAGEGIGIDRLVMIFTNAPSIREVILFPQLRDIPQP